MTSNPVDDARLEHLAQLPILASDPTRADRARRRCHAVLARQQRRGEHVAWRIDTTRHGLVRVIVGTLCVFVIVYLTALVSTAIRLQGLLNSRPMP